MFEEHKLRRANTMLHGAENHIREISKERENDDIFHTRNALIELLHAVGLILYDLQKDHKELKDVENSLHLLLERVHKGDV